MDASMLINAELSEASSGERIDVFNPARPAERVGTMPRGGREDVDRAVLAATTAAPGWAALAPAERVALLAAAADALGPLIADAAKTQTREMGKILAESMADVGTADFMLRFNPPIAVQALETERVQDDLGSVAIEKRPFGAVGIIVPWNWPVSLLFVRLSAALAVGNTAVCLPSPYASLSVLQAAEAVARVLPPGVLNVVTGHGQEVGRAITEHPQIRRVSFTGSIATGRDVLQAASANIKVTSLELGGNDAAVILDDVEVNDAMIDGLVAATMTSAGQVCFAVKRLYVADSRFDEVVEAFSQRLSTFIVGDGLDPATTMGPLVNANQAKRLDKLLDEARSRGAHLNELGTLADGCDPEGYFRMPTVVTDVDESFQIVSEEQFGPAVPVMPFSDIDDAVQRANDTEYGLGASVWSADPGRAKEVGRRLEAGMVFINRHDVASAHPRGAFGGMKQSGLGRELGRFGPESYVEIQQVVDPA